MNIDLWKKLMAPRRKSDIAMSIILIIVLISFGFSDHSSVEIVKHCLASFGFLWLYLKYMKPADFAVDSLLDSLKEHGDSRIEVTDPLAVADAAKDRLGKYSLEIMRLKHEQQTMKDQRLHEMANANHDLIVHHRSTKKMLGSFRIEEVFDALLKGVREGLGFRGTVLGIVDRDCNLLIRVDSDMAIGTRTIQVPAWIDNSIIANTFWSGNSLLAETIGEHPHVSEDVEVIGDGPFFLIPISRKQSSKCSDVKNCGSIECSSYHSRNGHCWLEHHGDCAANISVPHPVRRRACVQCEMFAPTAVLVLRSCPESKIISRETVIPVVTLVNEASMALEVVELHDNMRKLSITDGLTGLYNHREFYQQLRRELERARRYRHSVSLLILDVDDFKKFNDRFGHLAGDLALKKIADQLRNCARATDIVARYGGEEFAVILPESTSVGALMLAERIKTDIGKHIFLPNVPEDSHLTVSVGIYTAEEGAATEDQIVRMADEAAYSAKNTGKNRVVVRAHA